MFVSFMALTLLLVLALQCPDGSLPPCPGARSAAPAITSIAVLDFANVSRDSADDYIGEGLAEELTSRLGQLGRLTVASRATVRRIRNAASMPVSQLGRTLHVAHILTGSVRRAGQRYRINVELLRASTGAQVWASQYDRSDGDLLTIQEAIATEVANAVAGRLLPAERRTLASRPTGSLEAYEAYLRGRVMYQQFTLERAFEVVRMFERAVQLDPRFADAWAMLSRAQGRLYSGNVDRSLERADLVRAAAERAVALAPGSAMSQTALGYYHYWVGSDYEAALRAFSAALAVQPNDIEVHNAIANVARRQGRWDFVQESRSHAMRLDPANPLPVVNRAGGWLMLRRFPETRADIRRALPLLADSVFAWSLAVEVSLASGEAPDSHAVEYLWRRAADLNQALTIYVNVLRSVPRLRDALDTVAPPATPDARLAHYAILGELLSVRGRPEAADALDSARVIGEALVRRSPDADAFRAHLALAYARLNRCDEARRAAAQAVTLLPVSRDAYLGPDRLLMQAYVASICGDRDQAVDLVAQLLRIPARLTTAWLRVDPIWAPLRGMPRFDSLIASN